MRGNCLPCSQGDGQRVGLTCNLKPLYRAAFMAQHLVGGLAVSVEINHPMHALFGARRSLVANMCAVVVIAEENEPGHEAQLPTDTGMIDQHFNSPGITFRPFGNAGAVSILGNDDRLFRKSLMDLL